MNHNQLTEDGALFAVDVVHVIAFVVGAFEHVKDQTILAQSWAGDSTLIRSIENYNITTICLNHFYLKIMLNSFTWQT